MLLLVDHAVQQERGIILPGLMSVGEEGKKGAWEQTTWNFKEVGLDNLLGTPV